MNLTTIERVRALAEVDTFGTKAEALAVSAIASVSATLERALRRGVEAKERTETLRVDWGQRVIALANYPITSISSVRSNRIPVFTDVDPWVQNEDYFFDPDRGEITLMRAPEFFVDIAGNACAQSHVRVVYVAGMAASTAAFITAFPDLAAACDQQVRYLLQRADNLGGNSKTSEGETTFSRDYTLLPSVMKACEHHARGF